MNETPAPRNLFATKTAFCQYAVNLVAIYPPVSQWIAQNPQLALLGFSALNLAIRRITHGRTALFGDSTDSL